jgi:hypothetical protein
MSAPPSGITSPWINAANPVESSKRPPIVLLDGLAGAPWRLRWLQKHLQKAGSDEVVIFPYRSDGTIPIEILADQFAVFLKGLGDCPMVVAHSMGGLITRAAVARHPDLKLQRAVMLCVPHSGSRLAGWIPPFLRWEGVRQMAPDSPFLRWLGQQPWDIPTLVVWCPGDLLVLPGSHARWPCATEEEVCHFPLHNWPLVSPHFHRKIAQFLQHGNQPSLPLTL